MQSPKVTKNLLSLDQKAPPPPNLKMSQFRMSAALGTQPTSGSLHIQTPAHYETIHQLYKMHYYCSSVVWYANLSEGSIVSWQAMEQELLRQFHNMQRCAGEDLPLNAHRSLPNKNWSTCALITSGTLSV